MFAIYLFISNFDKICLEHVKIIILKCFCMNIKKKNVKNVKNVIKEKKMSKYITEDIGISPDLDREDSDEEKSNEENSDEEKCDEESSNE